MCGRGNRRGIGGTGSCCGKGNVNAFGRRVRGRLLR